MKKKRGPAAASPTSKAKVSTAQQGAVTEDTKHHTGKKGKVFVVPIEIAFQRVKPGSQITEVMDCLASTTDFVAMPIIAKRSGTYVVHTVVAEIRRRFHWIIENRKKHVGFERHSEYRLIDPQPVSGSLNRATHSTDHDQHHSPTPIADIDSCSISTIVHRNGNSRDNT